MAQARVVGKEMGQDFGGRESRDDGRTFVAHVSAADRTNEAPERLLRTAAREKPTLEAGPLRRRTDHPDIAGILSPERRIGEAIVERMAVREDHKSRARSRLLDLVFGIVQPREMHAFGQGRRRVITVVEKGDRERKGSERARQGKSNMAGAEEEHMGLALCFGFLSSREPIEHRVVDRTQEKLHASAATLAEMGPERQIEPSFSRPFRDHVARHIDGVEFELPAADRAVARVSRHEHGRAGFARRRALRAGDRDEDRGLPKGQSFTNDRRERCHCAAFP